MGFDAGKRIKGRKRHIVTDGGYGGPKLRGATQKIGRSTLHILNRSDTAIGVAV